MIIEVCGTPCGWRAWEAGAEDLDMIIGRGDTEQEAIDDLMDQLDIPYTYAVEKKA